MSNFTKSIIAGATGVIIDKYYFEEREMNRSLYFGASVAAGVFIGTIASPMAPDFNLGSMGLKQIEERITEITFGSASAYILNKFVLKNDYSRDQLLYKLGAIALCDVVEELGSDLIAGRPLDYFN